jgi:glycosyltransferase involved in cell wall biosynthesis
MFTLRTSTELSQAGHDVTLLCCKNSTLSEKARQRNVNVLPLLNSDLQIPAAIFKLSKKISNSGFNIIHTHLSHDLWTLVPAVKLSRIKPKLFLTKHMGSGVSKKDLFHKFLYRNVDGIFAISNYVRDGVLSSVPIDQGKIHVLPPGISLEKYDKGLYDKNSLKNKYNIPNDSIIIGMAGRMTPGKGHEDYLSAVSALRNSMNKKITYLVIGSASYGEEDYEKQIRRLAGELNVEDIVRFTGFIDNIPEILSVLDIFVFPSHEESFGIIILEAMAMELPVIASRNAGVLDIVIHEETGLLVPPKEPDALANAIKQLVENQDLRSRLGKAGRKRVEKNYRIDDIISQLINYYGN